MADSIGISIGIERRRALDLRAPGGAGAAYQPPGFEVISLDCEITSYAPDGDLPLF